MAPTTSPTAVAGTVAAAWRRGTGAISWPDARCASHTAVHARTGATSDRDVNAGSAHGTKRDTAMLPIAFDTAPERPPDPQR